MDGLGGYLWTAAKAFPDIAQNVKCALKEIVIPGEEDTPIDKSKASQLINNKLASSDSEYPQKHAISEYPLKHAASDAAKTPKPVLKAPFFPKNRHNSHQIGTKVTKVNEQDNSLPFQNPKLSSTTMKQLKALTPDVPEPQHSLIKPNDRKSISEIKTFNGDVTLNNNPYTLTLEAPMHRLKLSNQPSSLDHKSPQVMGVPKTYTKCQTHTNNIINSCCRTCDFLPICDECNKMHEEHTITTILEGVGDVVEVFRECVSVVVDRHNVLEALIPEIRHFLEKSETMLKNVKRSVDKYSTCLLDTIKAKEDSTNSEIRQLLNVGSDKLNSLYKDSLAYSNYISERIKTLGDLEKTSTLNVGLALNTFIDLKPEYERLIYQCQDTPLLGQPLSPHWQVNPGNMQNLLATEEVFISNSSKKISNTWITLDSKIKEMAENIVTGKYQYALPPALTLDPPILVGTFLRRDWKRREWLQRVVTIRPPQLFIHAHPDDPNEKVESCFKITELECELFENSINPYVIEARRQHSHGIHLKLIADETRQYNSTDTVLLASSSSSIPRIWVQALNELKNIDKDAEDSAAVAQKSDLSPKTPLSFLKYARKGVEKYSIEHTDIDNNTINGLDVCRSPVHFSERQFTNESDKNDSLIPKLSISECLVDISKSKASSSRSGKDSDPYSLNREWSLSTKSLNRNKQKSKLFEYENSNLDRIDFSQIPQFVYEGSEGNAIDDN